MPGTREGALKAKLSNLAKNPNYYRELAQRNRGVPKKNALWSLHPELAAAAGRKSKRKRLDKTNANQ